MLTHNKCPKFSLKVFRYIKSATKKIINKGNICHKIMLTHKKLYRKLYPDTPLSKTKKIATHAIEA